MTTPEQLELEKLRALVRTLRDNDEDACDCGECVVCQLYEAVPLEQAVRSVGNGRPSEPDDECSPGMGTRMFCSKGTDGCDVDHRQRASEASACICPRLADYKSCPQHGASRTQDPLPDDEARATEFVKKHGPRMALGDHRGIVDLLVKEFADVRGQCTSEARPEHRTLIRRAADLVRKLPGGVVQVDVKLDDEQWASLTIHPRTDKAKP